MAITLHGTVSDNTVALDRKTATPLIINGDMQIAQRGTSATGLTNGSSGYHTCDRWQFTEFGAPSFVFTQTQSTDVPTGQGFSSSLKMDCTTAQGSLASADGLRISQRIEGQNLQMLKKGTSSAESVTLSFWVKSDKTGTYIAEILDKDNSRVIAKSYTISSSDTWEKKVLSFAGDTTGALDNDNARSFDISWWLAVGTDYSSGTLATSWEAQNNVNRAVGQVNLADSTSNNWYMTGVQLEVGSFDANSIPPFQFEDIGTSLLRCQRYYEKTNPATETPAQTDGAVGANWGILNAADSSTLVLSMIQWKVDKRVSPTMTYYATDGTSGSLNVNGTNRTVSSTYVGETNLGRINVASGGTAGNYVAFMFEASAEL